MHLAMSSRDARKPTPDAKRTLGRGNTWTTISVALASLPVLVRALARPMIPGALREKLMLEVTSVNDCGYCQWGHTYLALAQGVPLEEINQIFSSQNEGLSARDPGEAAAILFAQHYAECREDYDSGAMEDLRRYYTQAQATEILAYLRAITLGNLTGNTLAALAGRLRRPRRADR
jgi:AhpD family alkylhydroperoxidase